MIIRKEVQLTLKASPLNSRRSERLRVVFAIYRTYLLFKFVVKIMIIIQIRFQNISTCTVESLCRESSEGAIDYRRG